MKTRQKILEASAATFGHRPNATLDDVAAEADVSRITVIRHFKTKDDLLLETSAYCVESFDTVVAASQDDTIATLERVRQLLLRFAQLGNHYWFLLRATSVNEAEHESALKAQLNAVEALVKKAQDEGVLRPDLPAGWLACLIDFYAMAVSSASERGVVAARDLESLAWDTFLNGVQSASPS